VSFLGKWFQMPLNLSGMFVTVELLCGTRGGGRGKERNRAPAISKCLSSVQVEDITIGTESW
jgi:hypothetical protein